MKLVGYGLTQIQNPQTQFGIQKLCCSVDKKKSMHVINHAWKLFLIVKY